MHPQTMPTAMATSNDVYLGLGGDLICPEKIVTGERLSISKLIQSTIDQITDDSVLPLLQSESDYLQIGQPIRKRSISHPNLPDMELMTPFLDEDLMQLAAPPSLESAFASHSITSPTSIDKWTAEEEEPERSIVWSDVYSKEIVQPTQASKNDQEEMRALASHHLQLSPGSSHAYQFQSEELALCSRHIREQIAQFASMREKEKDETRQQLSLITKLLKLHRNKMKATSTGKKVRSHHHHPPHQPRMTEE